MPVADPDLEPLSSRAVQGDPSHAPVPAAGTAARPLAGAGAAVLLGLTVFLSAFLLFQVQPIIARYILPWFGSTPGVWTTSLLFFQLTLLVGYGYAHFAVVRLGWRRQAVVHGALLAVTLLALPITPPEAMKPMDASAPGLRILLILAASVGAPYALLSTTAPLIQRWYARLRPGGSPYRLYALSNTGSLLALVTYPFLVEPAVQLRHQTVGWSLGYVAFALLCAASVVLLWRSADGGAAAAVERPTSPRPTAGRILLWFLLSACGSGLLLAVTNQMSLDVAVVPFLWVLPLALYLVSFILCFDHERWYVRPLFLALLPLALGNAVRLLFFGANLGLVDQAVGYSTTLFVCCMCCHGELSRARPAADRLTLFFLVVSLGGAAGGLFVGLAAPALFRNLFELHWLLLGTFVLVSAVVLRLVAARPARTGGWRLDAAAWAWGVGFVTVAGAVALIVRPETWFDDPSSHALATFERWRSSLLPHGLLAVAITLLALEAFRQRRGVPRVEWYLAATGRARTATALLVAVGFVALSGSLRWQVIHTERRVIDQSRNFYGALAIKEREVETLDHRITLTHGRIRHGSQYVDYRSWPTSYYGPETGVGLAVQEHPLRADGSREFRVGVIGLGAGTVAAYANAKVDIDSPDWDTYVIRRSPRVPDYVAFYELNPQVVRWAREPFTFLSDAEARGAQVEVFEGDARIVLDRQAKSGECQRFDVLVVDAFSSDAIPMHLLTMEAVQLYLVHLQDDGVLAFHVTNRYVDLLPVVQRLADEVGMRTLYVENDSSTSRMVSSSDWVLLSRNLDFLDREVVRADEVPMPPAGPLWTDDFSSLFEVVELED